MVPPGPSRVSVSVKDAVVGVELGTGAFTQEVELQIAGKDAAWWAWKMRKFTWYSYSQWLDAMTRAVLKTVKDIESAGKEIYFAIHVESPGAGRSDVDHVDFSRALASYPRFMSKSELWTLMHVLSVVGHRVKGVIWLTPFSGLADPVVDTLDERSAVILPFDASYSGIQVQRTVKTIRGLIPNWFVAIYAVVGIGTRDSMKIWGAEVTAGKLPPYVQMVVGIEDRSSCVVSQFKLPDGASLPDEINLLLRCSLCCSGNDVMRTPYKFFKYRRGIDPRRCRSMLSLRPPRKHAFECKCPGDTQRGGDTASASWANSVPWFPGCSFCTGANLSAEQIVVNGSDDGVAADVAPDPADVEDIDAADARLGDETTPEDDFELGPL